MTTINKADSLLADASGDPLISHAQDHVADAATNTATNLATDYADDGTAKDLDTDARRVAAMNATNTRVNAIATALNTEAGKLNSILAILEAHGLMKDA
jgi:hypothetical protein